MFVNYRGMFDTGEVTMKILAVSDLHLEFNNELETSTIIDRLSSVEPDVLVIAGDISNKKSVFKVFSEKFKHVVYVRGNHEYWGSWLDPNKHLLDLPNVYELLNEKITIENKVFVGSTMWYPKTKDAVQKSFGFADFNMIPGFRNWVWKENQNFKKFLKNELPNRSVKNVAEHEYIVITHHAPSYKSVSKDWINDPMNSFFICDWGESIIKSKNIKLWIHGHVHNSFDYEINGTRVFCNPLGYKHEPNSDFHLNMVEI